MIRAIVIALVLVSGLAKAEEAANGAPGQPNITVNVQQPAPSAAPSRGVNIFSDSVFGDVGKPQTGPVNSKSSNTGTVRTLAGEADYNSGQREQWLNTCAQYRGNDSKAYRECFEGERKKAADGLRQSRDAVEKRQGLPLRNSATLPDVGTPEGERAFGGAEVESRAEKD